MDLAVGRSGRVLARCISLCGLLALCGTTTGSGPTACAQTVAFDRATIFIDPAHGGADSGTRIGIASGDQLLEKDVTLALAVRLRSLLSARGYRVVMSRSNDVEGGSVDQRAELANRSHAVGCIVLHASSSVAGVVVGTSALGTALMRVAAGERHRPEEGTSWASAQESYVRQSSRLANEVGTTLIRSDIPAIVMRVVTRPLDNLTCPAISVEVGGSLGVGDGVAGAANSSYQQRIAASIADALVAWSAKAEPVADATSSGKGERGVSP